jgi:microcystin-dependent protein
MKRRSTRWWAVLVAGTVAGALLGVGPVDAACVDSPFLGEICTFAGNYCPRGFLPADGRLLQIGQTQALFALLGTFFGGDGITTFALPDLRGAIVLGAGAGPVLPAVTLGQTGGGTTTATVLAGNDVQVPAGPLPFVALSQCVAIVGQFPPQP